MAASISIPLNMTPTGPVPTSPLTIRATLVAAVAETNPDYTANLPASLVEDIVSTDVGAITMLDQARVDSINSLPIVSNPYLTTLLGQQLGIPQGTPTNTSVDVVFSSPTSGPGSAIGYVLPAGFLVGDGTHQYQTQEGTVIGADGNSAVVTAVAVQSGSWAVPQGTVTSVLSSVPTVYTITVDNPQAGTPALGSESEESYQARVLQAQRAVGIGIVEYLFTALQAVPGVVPRLVNVLQVSNGWEVIVGGGDVYAVATAIFLGVSDISRLVGSQTPSRNVEVTLIQPPNTYEVVFVNPPAQIVTGTVTWNTNLPNFTSGAQVNALAAPALASYVDSITQGQPINVDVMVAIFQQAVASVLPATNISALTFAVNINGVLTPPGVGTVIIAGDPESYFSAADNAFTVAQG